MIPIVFSTDHNYVMPTGVTIASLLMADKEGSYSINVITSHDVTEEDKEKLRTQVSTLSPSSSIRFVEIGSEFDSGYEVRGISRACYYRLLIPWIFPEFDKIIYSDVDIIFQIGLGNLFSTEMGYNLFAGVKVHAAPGSSFARYIKKMNLNPEEYINSGLLLINSYAIRKESLRERIMAQAGKKFLYQDQDIINIIAAGRILPLPERFNMSPTYLAQYAMEGKGDIQPCILHYSGSKPWEAFTQCWQQWWKVYDATLFFDPKLNFKTSATILSYRAQLRRFRRSVTYRLNKMFK